MIGPTVHVTTFEWQLIRSIRQIQKDHKAKKFKVAGSTAELVFDPFDGIVDIEILVKDNKEERT